MDIKEHSEPTNDRVTVEAQANGQPQEPDQQQQDQQQHPRYEMAYANLTPSNQTVVVDPVSLIFISLNQITS